MKNHEDILVFYNKQPIYNPQGLIDYGKVTHRGHNGECYGESGTSNLQEKTNYPRTIIRVQSQIKTIHPTQKPVALFEYLIKTYTNEGDLILDNCAGSGTTGIACINTNRNYILIEKEPKYCAIFYDRVDKECPNYQFP